MENNFLNFFLNKKNCFPNFKFGAGGKLFMEGEHCCKLPSTPTEVFIFRSVFFISLFPMIRSYFSHDPRLLVRATIDDCYFGHNGRSFFRPRSTIVISAMIDDRYIPDHWRLLIVISAIKFDHSRAYSLCYSPADLLPDSLCVQTYELTHYMFNSFMWTRL